MTPALAIKRLRERQEAEREAKRMADIILRPNEIIEPNLKLGTHRFVSFGKDDRRDVIDEVMKWRGDLLRENIVRGGLLTAGRAQECRTDRNHFTIYVAHTALYGPALAKAQLNLFWNATRQEVDYATTVAKWRDSLINKYAVAESFLQTIEKNDLNDPRFEDIKGEIALQKIARIKKGSLYYSPG